MMYQFKELLSPDEQIRHYAQQAVKVLKDQHLPRWLVEKEIRFYQRRIQQRQAYLERQAKRIEEESARRATIVRPLGDPKQIAALQKTFKAKPKG